MFPFGHGAVAYTGGEPSEAEHMRERKSWIIEGIGAQAFERLARDLSGAALQSLLLEVMRERARTRTPAAVLRQYQRDRFCRPSAIDRRTSLAVDAALFAAAEGFEALELSPLAPLASCSSVALTDQNRVVSALRSTEVPADPTNVLALECALRLRAAPSVPVHLATSQRVVRAQPVPKLPGYAQHFRIFVLATGGVESEGRAFSVASVVRHARVLLAALESLERQGYAFGERFVEVLSTPERSAQANAIARALGDVATCKPLGHAYYSGGLRFMLWVTAADGSRVPLGDGGTFDWLAKLGSNRRAVFIASGLGAQLIPTLFQQRFKDA